MQPKALCGESGCQSEEMHWGAERSRQLLFVQPFGVSKQCSFLLLAAKDVHCFFPAPPMYYVFPFSTFSVFFKVVTEVC